MFDCDTHLSYINCFNSKQNCVHVKPTNTEIGKERKGRCDERNDRTDRDNIHSDSNYETPPYTCYVSLNSSAKHIIWMSHILSLAGITSY